MREKCMLVTPKSTFRGLILHKNLPSGPKNDRSFKFIRGASFYTKLFAKCVNIVFALSPSIKDPVE